MNRRRSTRARGAAAISLCLLLGDLLPFPALADEPPKPADSATEQRLKELEQKLDVLTKEIETLRLGETGPAEKPAVAAPELGLGPAASKVYAKIDVSSAVLYFGYKFDGHFVFNSEIEYEHAVTASDKSGETEVEFATLDWLSGKRAFNA